MKAEQKIKEEQERLAKVKKWAARIKKLADRKQNPLSEAEFCEKYDFHQSGLNRNKNGVSFPSARTVEKIERALKKEGV